ncbi:MAG: hypothetical protein AAF577_02500 [Pseudomonadota bacterium]
MDSPIEIAATVVSLVVGHFLTEAFLEYRRRVHGSGQRYQLRKSRFDGLAAIRIMALCIAFLLAFWPGGVPRPLPGMSMTKFFLMSAGAIVMLFYTLRYYIRWLMIPLMEVDGRHTSVYRRLGRPQEYTTDQIVRVQMREPFFSFRSGDMKCIDIALLFRDGGQLVIPSTMKGRKHVEALVEKLHFQRGVPVDHTNMSGKRPKPFEF